MAAACICSLAFAADTPAMKADEKTPMKAEKMMMKTMPMNNVYMMKEDGSRMAMCGCGKEFAVDAKSPMMMNGAMSMYCCSQECHDHAAKMSKEEMATGMETWMANFMPKMDAMPTNTMMKADAKMAMCGCGKEFAVTDKSMMICENGVNMYCCSEACHAMMMKMSAEDRMAAQMKIVKPMKAQPAESKN
jgi:CDGSH-type Zn-finger protein